MSRPHPFADLEEAPRAGVDPKRIERRSKTLRAMVWVTVFLAPIALLGWITALGSSGSVSEGAATSSPGRLAATEAVRVWLTSDASPLPGGEIISWNGATEVSSELDDQSGVTVTVESNSFTVGLRRQATTTTTARRRRSPLPPDGSCPSSSSSPTRTRGCVWWSTPTLARSPSSLRWSRPTTTRPRASGSNGPSTAAAETEGGSPPRSRRSSSSSR